LSVAAAVYGGQFINALNGEEVKCPRLCGRA
jgi:hypothetical protein